MGLAVVTVASGALPVVDVSAIAPRSGLPVTEATNGFGVPVTKVVGKPGLPVVFETIGVAAPVVYAAWSAATAVGVALSGGNLIATTTAAAGGQGVRVADASARLAGKLYFETTITNLTGSTIGVGTTASTYGPMITNATTGALEFFAAGNIWAGGTNTGISLGARANGDVIGVAVNLDDRKISFKKVSVPAGTWNNSGTADPATNVGGIPIPAGSMVPFNTHASVTGGVFATNFGASAFVGAVPAGFTSGWPA